MKKTLFVNLYGGPGVGKSVCAAALFAALKWERINTEIISEYAKQLVWEEAYPKLRNQIYILGKQYNKQFTVNGKVDVAVTDSPFILSLIYDDGRTEYLKEMALCAFHKFNNLNIFLERREANGYDPNGRTQKTESEAIVRDEEIKRFMSDNDIEYTTIVSAQDNIEQIMSIIRSRLEQK